MLKKTFFPLYALLHTLGQGLFFLIQYLFILFTALACVIAFRMLNRTKMYGKKNSRLEPNTIIISNHQSMMDSFMVGSMAFLPQILFKPYLTPWHLPDRKNFLSTLILKPFMKLWKTIPVNRNRHDFQAFKEALKVLKNGTLHVFIEGTRSQNRELMPPQPQVGGLILLSQARVLPIYFTGMHDVQPYRKKPGDPPKTWLRLFGKHVEWIFHFRCGNSISLIIGKPITWEQTLKLAGNGDFRERSQRLAKRIHEHIEALKKHVEG